MQNSKIKNFDTELGNYLNSVIADIGISPVVLVLDKYLNQSKNVEKQVIADEYREQQARIEAERLEKEKEEIVQDLVDEIPTDIIINEVSEEMNAEKEML